MVIIFLKEPQRILEFIGNQILIIQSLLHCQEECCTVYDRRFHLKASAIVIAEWSCINITVWKMSSILQPVSLKVLSYKPPSQSFNVPTTSSSRVCLACNGSPNPQFPWPSSYFDHICYRCFHTNAPDKRLKALLLSK